MERVLVTGGAGFIGSQLTDRLLERGDEVAVVDNCSTGRRDWVPDEATVFERDLTDSDALEGVLTADIDRVFHLAASKAVDADAPHEQFRRNTRMTATVLQAMNEADVTELAYTSSSTVYGEAPRPTPEDYSPLEPISLYGASKLADEGLLSTYAHSHDFTVWNVRFANIVGPRLRGAVIPDFIEKLRDDPSTLTILGNGRQEKSYMHITDCLDALLTVVETTDDPMNTYNLGTQTTTSVTQIADIVSDELGLEPTYEYTGGDRGWVGDVPKMRLGIEKLSELGWEPRFESDGAVRRAAAQLLAEFERQPQPA
ncbi:NAD-dependent epimerase/dehydratase family protein [Natronolimnobius baerhuensis]|uniref:UDP-glucose 4-epimerase n=1 Tax=Natronolimnobius baerhuensis TaxID=253108 RepID=A0A202EA78_9EURY|nr:NAD-dependent epimerase/dehydratase family protein [Natronolimnobius baerhuensis]OVE85152.1 UDP-glucose 4-epimerase [Natronolimnobius baerhuensis]